MDDIGPQLLFECGLQITKCGFYTRLYGNYWNTDKKYPMGIPAWKQKEKKKRKIPKIQPSQITCTYPQRPTHSCSDCLYLDLPDHPSTPVGSLQHSLLGTSAASCQSNHLATWAHKKEKIRKWATHLYDHFPALKTFSDLKEETNFSSLKQHKKERKKNAEVIYHPPSSFSTLVMSACLQKVSSSSRTAW